MQHSRACFATQGKANQLECLTQPSRATCVGRDDAGYALPEDPTGAGLRLTDEATDGELDGDSDTVPGEIGQCPDIAAVHSEGGSTTERAERAGGRCRHEDGDCGAVDTEQIETETRGGWEGGWEAWRRSLTGKCFQVVISSPSPLKRESLHSTVL